jgi:hypothetical protein
MAPANEKQQAHDLIERLAPSQISAVVHLLEVMTDPVAHSLANAPIDDEPISEEEMCAVDASREWLKDHEPISHEEVLSEFGLTLEDFERMGRTPLDPHRKGQ